MGPVKKGTLLLFSSGMIFHQPSLSFQPPILAPKTLLSQYEPRSVAPPVSTSRLFNCQRLSDMVVEQHAAVNTGTASRQLPLTLLRSGGSSVDEDDPRAVLPEGKRRKLRQAAIHALGFVLPVVLTGWNVAIAAVSGGRVGGRASSSYSSSRSTTTRSYSRSSSSSSSSRSSSSRSSYSSGGSSSRSSSSSYKPSSSSRPRSSSSSSSQGSSRSSGSSSRGRVGGSTFKSSSSSSYSSSPSRPSSSSSYRAPSSSSSSSHSVGKPSISIRPHTTTIRSSGSSSSSKTRTKNKKGSNSDNSGGGSRSEHGTSTYTRPPPSPSSSSPSSSFSLHLDLTPTYRSQPPVYYEYREDSGSSSSSSGRSEVGTSTTQKSKDPAIVKDKCATDEERRETKGATPKGSSGNGADVCEDQGHTEKKVAEARVKHPTSGELVAAGALAVAAAGVYVIAGGDADADDPLYNIAVHVAIQDTPQLMQSLQDVANDADTTTQQGLAALGSEVCLLLLRHTEGWHAARCESTRHNDLTEAEEEFDVLSLRERKKWKHEREYGMLGQALRKVRVSTGGDDEAAAADGKMLMMVNLLVTCRARDGVFTKPARTAKQLEATLERLAASLQSGDASHVLAVECSWTPDRIDDVLTWTELREKWPELVDL